MAPRSRHIAVDADTSMSDAPDPVAQVDEMVSPDYTAGCSLSSRRSIAMSWATTCLQSLFYAAKLTSNQQVDTPDYSDSDTNPNTTASSVAGDLVDGRKKRSEANLLRRSVFGKKHDALGDSKVGYAFPTLIPALWAALLQ